jgi:hypothetical protein
MCRTRSRPSMGSCSLEEKLEEWDYEPIRPPTYQPIHKLGEPMASSVLPSRRIPVSMKSYLAEFPFRRILISPNSYYR